VRLKQIKLAGFKSFVDPTAFEVPSQLVGVVGPNGCGKSNIMDAVRWVLGESRASELRGESMQDVIFNGSSERKPAVRASVELVFDNSSGRIGGHWSQYAELSVRRVLSRDGQSSYYINGQSVRRRDVHEIFLGTGLGPRAYAIIGQGMISRIIEARPEELRVFLEEAAGVSRYKERRKETAGRLQDTRENLTRVEDILRELNAQIERLEEQAEVAREFQRLDAERDRSQKLLWILRRDEADSERQKLQALVLRASSELDARIAALRELEARIESLRQAHYAAGDEVHSAQGRFYECNAEISRIEGEIRLVSQTQGQLRERLDSVEAQSGRAASQQDQARAELEAVCQQLGSARLRSESLAGDLAGSAGALTSLEESVAMARGHFDEARQGLASVRQAIEISQLQQRRAGGALEDARRRRERLLAEAATLGAFDPARLTAAGESLASAELADRLTLEQLTTVETDWTRLDAGRAPAREAQREAESRLARIEARIAALRQLQERIDSQAKVRPWLDQRGLGKQARVWQSVRIDAGWEMAVESALRERVNAVSVAGQAEGLGCADGTPPSRIGLWWASPGSPMPTPVQSGLRPLVSVVHTGDPGLAAALTDWLGGCYAAETLDEASRSVDRLPAGGRFFVPAGHSLGRTSLSLHAQDSEQDGVLARRQELENLVREQRAAQLLAEEARVTAQRAESAASQKLAELMALREQHNRQLRELAALRLEVQKLEQDRQRLAERRGRLDSELLELADSIAKLEIEIGSETDRAQGLASRLEQASEVADSARLRLEQAEAVLSSRRDSLRQQERDAQEAAFGVRALEASQERLEALIEQGREMALQADKDRESLLTRLQELSDAAAREALQLALQGRASAETALAEARQRLDSLTLSLRELEEKRLAAERDQEPMRQRITDLQLKEQAARIGHEQFASQLAAAQVDTLAEQALRMNVDTLPRPSWLQGEVNRLQSAIAVLGPVNMAALDELSQASERKGFLDAQSADLGEAIATLEDAIRRIDRETRSLLQQTYDTVNRHFGELFPQLFGGGEARLTLTGEEILDAGIQVTAQPPGKRNSSIHLLSGGEKALTAIALVFALFQLNPAPFCLLDEVDAPLDDANTDRYCEMVRRMSEQTQFLFITHNKVAMELAQQLIGVTMQERGVSRIVAVDLEAAHRMAEAA
jgi:chromosome segregation protein